MQKVTRQQAVKMIRESKGKIMTVLFAKRTTGELRSMNCRTGVVKHLKGGVSTHTPAHKLINVYDLKSQGYRSIAEEGIVQVQLDGEIFKVV